MDSYEVEQMLDWTPEFLDEFEKRYQYDPKPYLPILQGYSHFDTLIQKRFEADYSKLVSDLLIENHYGESVKIGDENGIQMITEAGHGGSPRVEPLKALGNSHIPMGEFWNRQRHWVTKEAASAAHIYGKNIVASESLTGWNHWQHGPADFKQLIDIAFCEGMNQVVFHTFSHNPEIAGKPGFVYHAGEHINVNATWWEYARPFMDYIARSSYLLRQGDFVADILMYYGDEAPNLVPPKRIDPNYTPDMPGIFPTFFYDKHKCPHCGRPKPIVHDHLHGYEYDYVNEDIITNSLKSKNGKLVLPHGPSYQVLVLPDREDISLEVLRKLDQLIFEGAIVLGPKPSRATSLKGFPENDREVIDLASKIWGDSDGKKVFSHTYGKGKVYWGKSIEEVLKDSGIQPDLGLKNIDNQDLHIDFVHRRTANEEIYFISNSSQKKEKVKAVFRVNPDMKPELWDAHTGLIQRDVQYSKIDDGIELEISLDPIDSRFVVFRERSSGKNDKELHVNLQKGKWGTISDQGVGQSLDISSSWEVRFDPEMGPSQSIILDKLVSWSEMKEEKAKFYSGAATFSKKFSIQKDMLHQNQEAFVVFDDIQEMGQVFVNGHDCGIVWLPPYAARITPYLQQGENNISIRVINTWNNRIVGDWVSPDEMPFTKTNAKNKFTKNSPLLKSGLMGKCQIKFL